MFSDSCSPSISTMSPALFVMQTGRMLSGRPSMGAWVVYKLGSENQNLPGYVVLDDPKGLPINAIQNWQQDRVSASPHRLGPGRPSVWNAKCKMRGSTR